MIDLAMPTGTKVSLDRTLARARGGFSLIELVIVVVIIGIIAAIAVPRMSRGASGASDGALSANLTVLRNAVDLYQTEHQAYPASAAGATSTDFVNQLTKFSDSNGASVASKDASHPFGPYLRKIPPMPVGSKKTKTDTKIAVTETEAPGTTSEAWIYYPTTGEVKANLLATELDGKDQPYNGY